MTKQGRPDAERNKGGKFTETLSLADVVYVFRNREPENEPLTATEVADELGCNRKTAYNKLQELADDGKLYTKKVGASARVFWL